MADDNKIPDDCFKLWKMAKMRQSRRLLGLTVSYIPSWIFQNTNIHLKLVVLCLKE